MKLAADVSGGYSSVFRSSSPVPPSFPAAFPIVRYRFLILCVLAAAPGVAHAQDSRLPLEPGCTRERVRAERPRRDRRTPEEIRRDSLDSALRDTVRERVMDAARQAGVAEPYGDLVVELQDRQTGAARAFVDANVSGEVVQGVLDRSAALLATWQGRDPYFSVSLPPGGPRPALDTPGATITECRPLPLNAGAVRQAFLRLMSTDTTVRGALDARVRALVSRNGRVLYAYVSAGNASPATREALIAITQQAVFRPASINGEPLNVWTEQPYAFVFQR